MWAAVESGRPGMVFGSQELRRNIESALKTIVVRRSGPATAMGIVSAFRQPGETAVAVSAVAGECFEVSVLHREFEVEFWAVNSNGRLRLVSLEPCTGDLRGACIWSARVVLRHRHRTWGASPERLASPGRCDA